MRQNETGPARARDSEDRIHRVLALLLGALAGGLLLTREPVVPEPAGSRGISNIRATEGPSRAALEAGISELARWFEQPENDAASALDANLRLLALGRSVLQSSRHGRAAAAALENLDAFARPAASGAHPVSLPQPAAERSERDASPAATLAILLETGAPLDDELTLPSGQASLRRLLGLALPSAAERRPDADPWSLDLLSFAVLAGMPRRREDLERQTVAGLGRLERDQRRLTAAIGDASRTAEAPDELGRELQQRGAEGGWSRELALGAAVFRAVAVLGDPGLEQRALRHLNALSLRQELERELREQRLARARTPEEGFEARLQSLEALGRLEQALYGAHLAFRREDRPAPPPRTASSMRRAAGELLAELDALRTSGAFSAAGGAEVTRRQRLQRAAAHALRGLRAARVAI